MIGGWFEATAVSADDRRRGEMYRQNLQRAAARQSFGNYEDYLRSLEMRCELGPFDTPHAERITQLINKTNQFNLTTRRYTAAEVEDGLWKRSPSAAISTRISVCSISGIIR